MSLPVCTFHAPALEASPPPLYIVTLDHVASSIRAPACRGVPEETQEEPFPHTPPLPPRAALSPSIHTTSLRTPPQQFRFTAGSRHPRHSIMLATRARFICFSRFFFDLRSAFVRLAFCFLASAAGSRTATMMWENGQAKRGKRGGERRGGAALAQPPKNGRNRVRVVQLRRKRVSIASTWSGRPFSPFTRLPPASTFRFLGRSAPHLTAKKNS